MVRVRGNHATACLGGLEVQEMAEMAEHRVSMLGSSLRRFEDPTRSADPRIRAVVAGLRTLEIAPPARAHFRAELRAQPGDALYGLKRASENVELSLASGPTDKANLLLDFAKTRADEVNQLLSRASSVAVGRGATASGQISSHTADLIRSTLASADS